MSAGWDGGALLQPIAADKPCGEDVEYTLLPVLDGFQVFGQSRRLDVPDTAPPNGGERPWKPPDWGEIRERALEGVSRSKDLRLLAHLAAALLRTDGVPAFVRTLSIASQWLTEYWPGVYPVVDQDAMTRRNALNCLADPMAVIDALRRAPLVASRQHGKVGVRDVEIATGAQQPIAGEARIDDAEIKAAFAEAPLDDLVVLQESVTGGLASLKQIETTMLTQGGSGAVPDFDTLSAQLAKIDRVLREQVASRAPAAENAVSAAMATPGGEVMAVGNIRSRQDAIRALEAAAEFFRRNEPSSPVPLLIDRAKRLVSKNFLEVLADVAPDGLSQARSVSGVSNGE